jgi:hypothetical protein
MVKRTKVDESEQEESDDLDSDSDDSVDLASSSSSGASVGGEDDDGSVGSIPSEPVSKKQRALEKDTSPQKSADTTKKSSSSKDAYVNHKSGPQAASATKIQAPALKKAPPTKTETKANALEPANTIFNNVSGGGNSSEDITRGPPITTDSAAKKLIGQYLRQQNRPYSAIQVHDNLHKRVPKATCERVLTALCEPGMGYICKEYGKAKIYFVDQSTLTSNFTPTQLDTLLQQNDDLAKEVEYAAGEEKRLKQQLQQLVHEPTDEDLDTLLAEAREIVRLKTEKVNTLSNAGNQAASSSSSGGALSRGSSSSSSAPSSSSMKTLAHCVQAHNYYRKVWAARKQLCMDAADLLSEGMNKKVKDVLVRPRS